MKTRWKIWIGVGLFLALVTVSMVLSFHFQPESTVAAYEQSLRAKGEKLQISELIPPPVPAQSNSVNAVQQAFKMLAPSPEDIPWQMKSVAPGKAMVGWSQPDARGYDFTNSWKDFATEITADQPAIALLHQVLQRPKLDFHLDYKQGTSLLLPQLPAMKRAAQTLDAAAMCELHFNHTGSATTNILTMLGFVQKDSADRLLISHLVRLAIAAIAVPPTWELLQNTNATELQLADLQKGWEKLDLLADAETSLEMERAWGIKDIQNLRTNRENLKSMFAMFSGHGGLGGLGHRASGLMALTAGPRLAIAEAMWRSSWSYSDELNLLKTDTLVLEILRKLQADPNQNFKVAYDALDKRLSSITNDYAGASFFRALHVPGVDDSFHIYSPGAIVRKDLQMETARRIVVTAIALRRFQLKHGKLPKTIEELAPDFLSTVPMDPMDGKPLRYHPNGDGTFLLYSVGENGVDDGGSPSFAAGVHSSDDYWLNLHALDWVWPQPATKQEIREYFKKKAKYSN